MKKEEVEKPSLWENILVEALKWVLIVVILGVICIYVVEIAGIRYPYYIVDGSSMQPTINPDIFEAGFPTEFGKKQDGVMLDTKRQPVAGDIIIIRREEDSPLIKRLIAQEGDYVSIKKGPDNYFHVYVMRGEWGDPQALNEEYLVNRGVNIFETWNAISTHQYLNVQYEAKFYSQFISPYISREAEVRDKYLKYHEESGTYYFRVPEDKIFFLGDNRPVSLDCRSLGLKTEDDIIGVVVALVPNAKFAKTTGALTKKKISAILPYLWQKLCEFFSF